MRQQVRFASHKTVNVYTPESSNLGLSYTDSPSQASSSGPLTPPSHYPVHLPPPLVAYSSRGYEPFQVRPFAAPPPPPSLRLGQIHRHLSTTSGFHYDLSLSPETVAHHYRLPIQLLAEYATSPPVTHMQISIPYLPWRIPVHATRMYVSIEDVLNALYTSFRKNIGQSDYAVLSPSAQRRVKEAYDRRCRSNRDPRMQDRERWGGVKRIDFLMDRKCFRGLTRTSMPDLWQLEVT